MVCLQEVRALTKDAEGVRALKCAGGSPRQRQTEELELSTSDSDSDADEIAAANKGHLLANALATRPPTYAAHLSLCQSKFGGKRFGVATYLSSHFANEHAYTAREVDWDSEGRVVVITVPNLRLCVINVYALNGSEYDWKDPLTNRVKGTRNERKREFNRLLMKECHSLQSGHQRYRLIVIGDFNISREARDCFPRLRTEHPHALARKEFNEIFMPTLGVVDIFRELHGDKRSYSWFSPSKPDGSDAARVDSALASRELLPCINSMEYLEERRWRFKSDHAPMKLVLDIDKLRSTLSDG